MQSRVATFSRCLFLFNPMCSVVIISGLLLPPYPGWQFFKNNFHHLFLYPPFFFWCFGLYFWMCGSRNIVFLTMCTQGCKTNTIPYICVSVFPCIPKLRNHGSSFRSIHDFANKEQKVSNSDVLCVFAVNIVTHI